MNNKIMSEKAEINDLRQAIVGTIAFFDMFDFPLTYLEVWKYLPVRCGLAEVQAELLSKELDNVIGNKNGFFYLRGREKIVITRMKRYNYANAKFKKALRIARIFKFIPWIKMIAVGNMIGANNLKQESDIDLFIITEKKRIWLARFFCVSLTDLLRLRPQQNNFRDKICLSFFVSEEAMSLEQLTLDSDYYFLHWLSDLTPIYNKDNAYEKLIAANTWLTNKMPNWEPMITNKRTIRKPVSIFYRDFINLLFSNWEGVAKRLQLKMMPADIKKIMNIDSRVVVNDQVLKFHKNDRRKEYNNMFRKKITRNSNF